MTQLRSCGLYAVLATRHGTAGVPLRWLQMTTFAGWANVQDIAADPSQHHNVTRSVDCAIMLYVDDYCWWKMVDVGEPPGKCLLVNHCWSWLILAGCWASQSNRTRCSHLLGIFFQGHTCCSCHLLNSVGFLKQMVGPMRGLCSRIATLINIGPIFNDMQIIVPWVIQSPTSFFLKTHITDKNFTDFGARI